MVISMTGYGRASSTFKDKTISVEVRSLNSKFSDIRLKIPQYYKEKELELRKIILGKAMRGKIDFVLEIKSLQGDGEFGLNVPLFKKYYHKLAELEKELGFQKGDIVQTILRIPNVVSEIEETIDDEEWQAVVKTLHEALHKFGEFRINEGEVLHNDFVKYCNNILDNLKKVKPYEDEREIKMKEKIQKRLSDFLGKENVDENRFEQEVLFYLEKIDITEEKLRLEQHCKYFLEELALEKNEKGKKLNFIGQEMGREINTLGAKAYSSDIQRIVVQMKDDLEKIKEQIANVV